MKYHGASPWHLEETSETFFGFCQSPNVDDRRRVEMITYKTKDTHPGTLPWATIYLDGLLCLGFDQAKRCTVAVNNMTGKEHTWKFVIEELDQKTGVPGKRIVDLKQGDTLSEVHIDVTGGTTLGAYVFNGSSPVSIPAIKAQRFNLEGSWIDLESRRAHGKHIENDANTLWPRFYINDGLFCASKLSSQSFALMDSNPTPHVRPLGPIALGAVADIFLDRSPDSKIEVRLSGRTVTLDRTKRHQIYISNGCGSDYVSDHARASYEPVHSDFHLHYQAFSGAVKPEDRFHLVTESAKVTAASAVAQSGRGYTIKAAQNDKAPCMLTALGQTSTFI